jgi:uncharacterized protein YbbC (DUF1343 family)
MRRRKFLAGFGGLAGLPFIGGASAAASGPGRGGAQRPRRVRSGIEELARQDYTLLDGQKVGIISNPTGVLPDLSHEVDDMVLRGHVNVVAAFGPEHGFRGSSQAGEGEDSFIDEKTGVTVYDAYASLPPSRIV